MSDYNLTSKEFKEKYNSQIVGIALKNNVDMSVATNMFQANLNNSNMGTLNASNNYQGGGVVQSNEWETMKSDYKNLKEVATKETKDKGLGYLLERDTEPEKKK